MLVMMIMPGLSLSTQNMHALDISKSLSYSGDDDSFCFDIVGLAYLLSPGQPRLCLVSENFLKSCFHFPLRMNK